MFDLLHTIAIVIAFAASVQPRCSDPIKLHASAPEYLTLESAGEHCDAADLAALITGTDAADLLSIAWHESRYQRTAITPEPGGRFSCGVMTPAPIYDRAACEAATMSLVAGYLAGALHLREWLIVCRGNRACALRGYAGAATSQCNIDPNRACRAAWEFDRRARVLR